MDVKIFNIFNIFIFAFIFSICFFIQCILETCICCYCAASKCLLLKVCKGLKQKRERCNRKKERKRTETKIKETKINNAFLHDVGNAIKDMLAAYAESPPTGHVIDDPKVNLAHARVFSFGPTHDRCYQPPAMENVANFHLRYVPTALMTHPRRLWSTRGHCWGAPTPLERGLAYPISVLSSR